MFRKHSHTSIQSLLGQQTGPEAKTAQKLRVPENLSCWSQACTTSLNEGKVCNVPVHLLMLLCLNVVLGELPRSSRNIFLNALHSTEKSFATEIEEWLISSAAAAPAFPSLRQRSSSLCHGRRSWETQEQLPECVNRTEFWLAFKTSDPWLSSGGAQETDWQTAPKHSLPRGEFCISAF